MKSFEFIQKMFGWFQIRAINGDASTREKIFDIIRFGAIILNPFIFVISSITFMYRHLDDFNACLYAFLQVAAVAVIGYDIIHAYLMRRQLSETFSMFQQIYDEHKGDETFPILIHANSQSEKLLKFSTKHVTVGYFVFAMILGMVQLAFIIHKFLSDGYMNKDYFIIPFKLASLWDAHTLIGWICAFIFWEFQAALCILMLAIILFFFVGISLHHSAFRKQFAGFTTKLNHLILNVDQSAHNRIKIKTWLVKIINFHISTTSIFTKTANFYSAIIFAELISSTVRISISVFQIDTLIDHPNLDLFTVLVTLIFGMGSLFIYCYFGKKATDSYLMFGDYLYKMEWFKLPIDRQKDLILIISSTQRPIYYHVLKVVDMNLTTFTKVLKMVWSFYLMFKTLTNA